MFLIILGGVLIFTTLHYFNIIGDKIMTIVKLLLPIISIVFGVKHYAENQIKKALKLGAPIIVLALIVSLIFFNNDITWKNLIYYLILVMSSIAPTYLKRKKEDE